MNGAQPAHATGDQPCPAKPASRLILAIAVLAGVMLAAPAISSANHVTAHPTINASLGEQTGGGNWYVNVSWSVGCRASGSTVAAEVSSADGL